jgi:hypothetical protein
MKLSPDLSPSERQLLERTKEFVAKACPALPESERIHVVAKIYEKMRFTLQYFERTKSD